MTVEFADQYKRPCLVLDGTESGSDVIERAYRDEAIYREDDEDCFVVRFPGRPQEIYTETANFGAKCIEVTLPDLEANIICLAEWKGDEFDHGALAHEAFHAAEHVLSKRGVVLNEHTTESYAYLVQEIVDRSLQIINNKTR